jgi:hypothetical protein
MEAPVNRRTFILPATLAVLAIAVTLQSRPAGAQIPVPSEGAINTSRSNIKSTARTGQVASITIDLFALEGSAPPRSATTNERGEFTFGVVPAGNYRLVIRRAPGPEGVRSTPGAGGAPAPDSIRFHVTIEGTEAGPIEALMTAASPSDNPGPEGSQLDSRIEHVKGSLDGRYGGSQFGGHQGQLNFRNIVLRSTGRTEVKGTARFGTMRP